MIDPLELLRDRAKRLSSETGDLVLRIADALSRLDVGNWAKPGAGVLVLDEALRDLDEAVQRRTP